MDVQYLVWLGVPALGAVLGLFIQPKTLAWFCTSLFVMAILGIVVGYSSGRENSGFMFCVVSMAIPVLGALLVGGAALGRTVLKRTKTKDKVNDAA